MSPRPGSVRFAGNVYVSPKASRFEWQGKSVDGIAAWRSVFGQERGSGRNLGGEARAPVASASSSPQAPDLTVAIPTSASIEALRRSAALNLAGEFGVDLPTGKIGADPRMGRRP